VDFDTARKIALAVAGQDEEEPMLIAWNDLTSSMERYPLANLDLESHTLLEILPEYT